MMERQRERKARSLNNGETERKKDNIVEEWKKRTSAKKFSEQIESASF